MCKEEKQEENTEGEGEERRGTKWRPRKGVGKMQKLEENENLEWRNKKYMQRRKEEKTRRGRRRKTRKTKWRPRVWCGLDGRSS